MPGGPSGRRGPGVREFSVPATTEVGPDEAIPDLLATNVAEHGDEVGLRVHRDGQWRDGTWEEVGDQVAGGAKGIIAAGGGPGGRGAPPAPPRDEWAGGGLA